MNKIVLMLFRWVCVVVAPIVVCAVINGISNVLYKNMDRIIDGFGRLDRLHDLLFYVTPQLICGFLIPLAVYAVAPKGKAITAVVISTIYGTLNVFGLLVAIHYNRLLSVAGLVSAVISVVVGTIYVCKISNNMRECRNGDLTKGDYV